MKLAKSHLDIGLFTNAITQHREFWSDTIGLTFDHELEMAPGWVIHRFDAHGSVIKVNHRVDDLPHRPASGFATLTIARDTERDDWAGPHPDGDRVELVAPGTDGVTGIGITISTPNPDRLLDFYDAGPGRVRCGDSLVTVVEGPGGSDLEDYAAPGYRYLTVQVYDADDEMDGVVRRGGRIAREAVNYPGVARYGFVADPDGNWVELSARTQWTGVDVS
jgi:lactoylglutathione lyase